ncbi:MAG: hypothetical protein M1829_000735 [Trizodia sp. TS-e1964]|nr:MAG: hypothetical protein M1829_000735 [Trizodia sp. TS-e1964]
MEQGQGEGGWDRRSNEIGALKRRMPACSSYRTAQFELQQHKEGGTRPGSAPSSTTNSSHRQPDQSTEGPTAALAAIRLRDRRAETETERQRRLMDVRRARSRVEAYTETAAENEGESRETEGRMRKEEREMTRRGENPVFYTFRGFIVVYGKLTTGKGDKQCNARKPIARRPEMAEISGNLAASFLARIGRAKCNIGGKCDGAWRWWGAMPLLAGKSSIEKGKGDGDGDGRWSCDRASCDRARPSRSFAPATSIRPGTRSGPGEGLQSALSPSQTHENTTMGEAEEANEGEERRQDVEFAVSAKSTAGPAWRSVRPKRRFSSPILPPPPPLTFLLFPLFS